MIATYRLQLTPEQGFAHATALVPYLAALGVSHLYLSPVTDARRGSTHGYDVIDHGRIRDELGGEAAFEALREAAHAAGLALILDFVPNHAGVGPRNARWQDVLAYGPDSPFAKCFDIDWRPLKHELTGKILLPVLGKPYGDAVDEGEIGVAVHDGRLAATYWQQRFTMAPHTYGDALAHAAASLGGAAGERAVELGRAFAALAPRDREQAESLCASLQSLASEVNLDGALAGIAPATMHRLLEGQFFRLAYWKTAGSEINYRRFFSINELVALRVEDPDVFRETHALLFELLKRPGIDGVRVDHVDGLFGPREYLERLRDGGAKHVWVEKILAPDEALPASWPCEGTTGYEHATDVLRLFTWPGSERAMTRIQRIHVPAARPFAEEVHRGKRLVMRSDLGGELERLAAGLDRFSEADYHTRDFTRDALREALAEVIAAFPRYRTYLPDDRESEAEVVQAALDAAAARNRTLDASLFAFIGRVLLGSLGERLEAERAAWVGRFQQYTAPVMAKGVEDTAFYRQPRLAAHAEVGNDPERWSMDAEEFHARSAARPKRNLLASSTHDTKRGEDLRMRMLVLSELPAEWRRTAAKLRALGAAHRSPEGPSDGDAYLFFQTLVAIWEGADRETLADRLAAYAQKAAREAKLSTSWFAPDERYERALDAFVRGVVADPALPGVIGPLARELAVHGFTNTLSMLALKTCSPGVPDVYRGAESLELNLVDPDNRRPLDAGALRSMLGEIAPLVRGEVALADGGTRESPRIEEVLARRDGLAKMLATARLLAARRDHAALFEHGAYRALAAPPHALAFAREHEGRALVVAIPLHPARLARAGGFGDARLSHPWEARVALDVLTGTALEPGPLVLSATRPVVALYG